MTERTSTWREAAGRKRQDNQTRRQPEARPAWAKKSQQREPEGGNGCHRQRRLQHAASRILEQGVGRPRALREASQDGTRVLSLERDAEAL